MAGNISPMSPISPTPLVREKRHYPDEHKDKNLKKQQQADSTDDDEQPETESEDESQQKPVNIDEKNVKVGHIDEYV